MAVVVIAAAAWWMARAPKPAASFSPTSTTLAVLPFQNLGADQKLDFLRFALPDEVATVLSYAPSLAIRPMAATRRFSDADVDPQAAGRQLEVSQVVAGHFLDEAGTLQVTVEVIDTEANRLVWRDSVSGPADDLIGMRERLSASLRSGMLPLLGVAQTSSDGATRPASAEAYSLYLRAAALDTDPQPTLQAITLLDQAVDLDPGFAPAWNELGKRLYLNATYGDGGPAALKRSEESLQRAHRLDPALQDAIASLITIQVEGGDLAGALRQADDLARSNPGSARALFTQSYVLRYAGLIEESGRACDAAITLDPRNRGFRSCSMTFMQLGDYNHARDFIRLDAGSQWARLNATDILIREGHPDRALEMLRSVSAIFGPEALAIQDFCLGGSTEPVPPALVDRFVDQSLAGRDPEPKYMQAARIARCGFNDGALRLLRAAVEGNYLAYPAMDREPLFGSIRDTPEFAAIRTLAIERQKAILGQR